MLGKNEKGVEEQMSRWRYIMTTSKTDIDDEENVRYTTYGVEVVDSVGKVWSSYTDVSTRKALVEEIVDKCNRHSADVIHLEDILMDYLD